ncbi:MAG: hypothetical protein ACYS9Y_00290 [Planctomycetota bacterium]
MKSKITKLTAAAVIIIAIVAGINQLGGSIDPASVAWGNVVTRVDHLDYVHVYWLKSRGNDFIRHFESWYANGKLVTRGDKGDMVYDDDQTEQEFDEYGRRTTKGPSIFVKGQSFLELITAGLLSDDNEQLSRQIPDNVGDDFLIYEFGPPQEEPHSDYIETISITVGKNSLLPVQMKLYEKDSDDYDLVIFDYEAAEKPAEFFEPPTVQSPNGRSEVVLDGEEVVLDIQGSPGLKQAIVRLHSKYDGPSDEFPSDYIRSNNINVTPSFCRAVSERLSKTYKKKGGPIFRLDVTFVTDEGYQSGTNDIITLWLNEAQKCGVGSENGGLDNWPDGKYRNIKFSPLLKPTDREDTYIVEIRCWLRPKEN